MKKPAQPANPIESLTAEFFRDYPDYNFCRNLAVNVANQVVTHANALVLLGQKAVTAREQRTEIESKLNTKTVMTSGRAVRLCDLSLQQVMRLEDPALREALEFYFKHPYAHGRTRRTRWLPRIVRTFFLSTAVGHAHSRNIKLDYGAYFRMLKML